LFGCAPEVRARTSAAAPPDLAAALPDLFGSYICGDYAAYHAETDGVVRSPCDYDVDKLLSIGGEVDVQITTTAISLKFPDGTSFQGSCDGQTFSATRMSDFPYSDGCEWRGMETLSGTVDTSGSCNLTASYTYREGPISGDSCASPCTVDAQVKILRDHIIK
jgi:hypothetical protein